MCAVAIGLSFWVVGGCAGVGDEAREGTSAGAAGRQGPPAWVDNGKLGGPNSGPRSGPGKGPGTPRPGGGPDGVPVSGVGPDAYAGMAEPPPRLQCPPGAGRTGPRECFVKVPAGSFWMGAQAADPQGRNHDPDAQPDEGPPHQVSVDSFWIMQREAPASLMQRCVTEGHCDPSHVKADGGYATVSLAKGSAPEGRAANHLDWFGAGELCAFAGGRLPTEVEWAYAARGPDSLRWPWGNTPGCGVVDARADAPGENVRRDEAGMRTGDCTLDGPPMPDMVMGTSPFGLYGAGGDVWEWTSTRYAPYPGGPALSEAVAERTLYVQRGGGWTSESATDLRSAGRLAMPPELQLNDVGVRCVWGRP